MIITGFDIESTDVLTAKKCKIIEIAAQQYDYNPFTKEVKLLSEFNERINPLCEVSKSAYEVHHISLADLKNCRLWKEVGKDFYDYILGSDLLVAHNGFEFDMPLLSRKLNLIGKEIPTKNGFDTMVEGRWATVDGKLPRLGELCFATDVEYNEDEAHAALYDVDCMMKAYFKGLELGFFNLEQDNNND